VRRSAAPLAASGASAFRGVGASGGATAAATGVIVGVIGDDATGEETTLGSGTLVFVPREKTQNTTPSARAAAPSDAESFQRGLRREPSP